MSICHTRGTNFRFSPLVALAPVLSPGTPRGAVGRRAWDGRAAAGGRVALRRSRFKNIYTQTDSDLEIQNDDYNDDYRSVLINVDDTPLHDLVDTYHRRSHVLMSLTPCRLPTSTFPPRVRTAGVSIGTRTKQVRYRAHKICRRDTPSTSTTANNT